MPQNKYKTVKSNKFSIIPSRLIFVDEALTGGENFTATPQINVNEGPSEAYKEHKASAIAASKASQQQEQKLKKYEAPDQWVRIVIFFVYKIDIGGVGTIEEAIASFDEEQMKGIKAYVAKLEAMDVEMRNAVLPVKK